MAALFTMRMTPEDRAELDLLVIEGKFKSAAECLKWLIRAHLDRACLVACRGEDAPR